VGRAIDPIAEGSNVGQVKDWKIDTCCFPG